MLQRSEDWFKIRTGKFTASNIYRLLGKENLAKTKQSIDTFAFEKAVEYLYGLNEDENYVTFDMQRGIDLEPLAFKKFKELKELDFIDVKECGFFKYKDHSGASPDGIVGKDAVLEIKCPKRNKFFKLVSNGINEIDFKYIAQMQMQMLCTKTKKAYFFNYLLENNKEYYHEIIIERDNEFIDLIKKRIEKAIEIKLDYITKISLNKQW